MEYQFRFNPFDGRHQIQMELGFVAFGRFIEDELGIDHAKIQRLLDGLKADSDFCFEGHEWTLQVEQGELSLCHHNLNLTDNELDPELTLDDSDNLSCCGLEDGIKLFSAWLDFVAPN
ncbi:YacL family protein [Gallaecimonas mangrovi]|uniref:YacL family protein n=1 Tax=Gallaecimonas mangrovi TaxID=2291597 RepID=UPI000E2089FA|nr:YacL family protein [Gallaecimonas mangrovi]